MNTDELLNKYFEAWKEYRRNRTTENFHRQLDAWRAYKEAFDASLK